MGVYSNYFKENSELVFDENYELTLEEQVKVKDMIIESLLDENNDFVNEGANQDYHDACKKMKEEFKEAAKKCNKSIKDGDKAEAKKQLKIMKDCVDKFEKTLKSVDSSTLDAVIGYFAAWLVNLIQSIPVAIVSLTGVGSIIASVAGTVDSVKEIIQFCKGLASDDNLASKLNLYRNKLLKYSGYLKDYIKQIEKKVDKL